LSVDEELQEHAQHARNPFDKRVAATMAIIAATLAVVSVLGHVCTTEEIVLQQRAADQWAFGQAKDIRRYASELALDLLAAVPGVNAPATVEKYRSNRDRYERETNENRKLAREFEKERDRRHTQAVRLHLGGVFLEIGIVLASIAILTKRPHFWWASIACSCAGLIGAITAAAIR